MKYKNSSILIVGGTGFLGLNLIKKAQAHGFKIYSLSKNKSSTELDNVTYFYLDLKNQKKIYKFIGSLKFNYVIYCSGYIEHNNFDDKGLSYIKTNIQNFNNLLASINLRNITKQYF